MDFSKSILLESACIKVCKITELSFGGNLLLVRGLKHSFLIKKKKE